MTRNLRIFLLSLAMLCLASAAAYSQDYIQVQGFVFNRNEKADPGSQFKYKLYDNVRVYIYETEAEGRRDARKLQEEIDRKNKSQGEYQFNFFPTDATEKSLEATSWPFVLKEVSPEGALIFFDELNANTFKLVMVKARTDIEVELEITGVTNTLDASYKKADFGPRIRIEPPVELGDTTTLTKGYLFEEQRLGRRDARFALQSYILSPENEKDTMEYRKAIVLDGEDYHSTQLRRMGYDASRDPLYAVADELPRLSDTTTRVSWTDKIVKGPKSRGGLIMADLWFEDYNRVYHSRTIEIEDLRRVVRPMQFLQYNLETTSLDPNDPLYKRLPQKYNLEGEMNLDVKFLVGKAAVDRRDSASVASLDSLKAIVYNVIHSEGSRLLAYTINGVASPEGNYASNVSLARERMKYIEKEVKSVIPQVYSMRTPRTNSRVATWEEFADTLAKDSTLLVYAEGIREIVRKYPGSMDKQAQQIRKLPYYNTVIKDNLGRLRMVSFTYRQNINRELTVQEILDRFHNEPDYRKGGAQERFIPHEFWVLMQELKDTVELESICRRAMEFDHRTQANPLYRWPLPANILATSYIKRHHMDTTVLAPFISADFPVNQPWMVGENRFLLNPSAVVANQVAMMIIGEHYTRAVQLAEMFAGSADPKLQNLYAIARCKAGYFRADTPEGEKYYNMVHDSSPRNAVVMDMAMHYDFALNEELAALDPEDPVTDYLKAQYECYKSFTKTNYNVFNMLEEEAQQRAIRSLVAAFRKDSSLIETAQADWYIFKGLYDNAMQEYNNPGSVLPPEPTAEEIAAQKVAEEELTEERKMEVLNKGNTNYGSLTPEEEEIYWKLSGM